LKYKAVGLPIRITVEEGVKYFCIEKDCGEVTQEKDTKCVSHEFIDVNQGD